MEQSVNQIVLCGSLASRPVWSHSNHGKEFYRFDLEVPRLSGVQDTLPVLASRQVMEQCDPFGGGQMQVLGQVRSFNDRSGQGRRLIVSVYAEQIAVKDAPAENTVSLQGVICKTPVYRRTPLGREICDVMLAVNRAYRRSDYLPCILWGRTAQQMALLPVGSALVLHGRLQSRVYYKQLETGREARTAYEVSVLSAFLKS